MLLCFKFLSLPFSSFCHCHSPKDQFNDWKGKCPVNFLGVPLCWDAPVVDPEKSQLHKFSLVHSGLTKCVPFLLFLTFINIPYKICSSFILRNIIFNVIIHR